MSLIKTLKRVVGLGEKPQAVGIDRTDHPLDFHPGSLVTIPEVDILMAQADGSRIANVNSNQTVISMSHFKLFGLDVYHSYLSDETSFIRTVADGLHVKEVNLFCRHDRIEPQTPEDWAFWLGGHNSNGIWESGLIGWDQFQIDNPEPTVYDKSWQSRPVEINERAIDSSGKNRYIKREAMEYNRSLNENLKEYLLATLADNGIEASVDIYIGIPLNASNIKVLAV